MQKLLSKIYCGFPKASSRFIHMKTNTVHHHFEKKNFHLNRTQHIIVHTKLRSNNFFELFVKSIRVNESQQLSR